MKAGFGSLHGRGTVHALPMVVTAPRSTGHGRGCIQLKKAVDIAAHLQGLQTTV